MRVVALGLCLLASAPAFAKKHTPEELAADLSAPEASRRLSAARELVALDNGIVDASVRVQLVRRALDDTDVDVRVAGVSAAGLLELGGLTGKVVSLATSTEPRLREAVAVALGALRPSDEAELRALELTLVRALADPEPVVRMAALRSLADRPVRPAARAAQLDAITTALGDERPELRRAAAETLERLADVSSLHALAAHVDDTSPEVRLAVAHALGALGDVRAAPAVLRLADDTSEEVRAAAVATLGALGAAVAVPRLAPILERPRDPMASVAAVALGRIAGGARPDDDATTTTLRARAGQALVAACRRGDNRSAALEGVRAAGSASAELLRPLLPALGPRPSDELMMVAADRAAHGDEAMTHLLLGAARLSTDGRFDAALTAARPRAGAARDELVLWLAARLGDPGAAARRAAAEALGALADPRATRALEALSNDPDPSTRRAGLAALAHTSSAAEPALVNATHDSDGELVRTAIAALARRKDDPARRALLALITSSDTTTQHAAAIALADDAGASIVVKPLIALLHAGPHGAREAAALALSGPLRGHADSIAREVCLGIAAGDDPGAAGALELLGIMRDRGAIDRLISMVPHLAKRPTRRARLYAVLGDLALGNGSTGAIEKTLVAGLSDPDALARASAAWALGKVATKSGVAALSLHLGDPSAAVRGNALASLGRSSAPPSAATLARLIQDHEPAVRANAVRLGATPALRDTSPSLMARAQAGAKLGPPHPGSDYLLLRIVDDAPTATRAAAARVGLPDGLVEIIAVDERGIARDEGVVAGELTVDVDASLLR